MLPVCKAEIWPEANKKWFDWAAAEAAIVVSVESFAVLQVQIAEQLLKDLAAAFEQGMWHAIETDWNTSFGLNGNTLLGIWAGDVFFCRVSPGEPICILVWSQEKKGTWKAARHCKILMASHGVWCMACQPTKLRLKWGELHSFGRWPLEPFGRLEQWPCADFGHKSAETTSALGWDLSISTVDLHSVTSAQFCTATVSYSLLQTDSTSFHICRNWKSTFGLEKSQKSHLFTASFGSWPGCARSCWTP